MDKLSDLFIYDEKTGRYRDKQTGRFLPRKDALDLYEWALSETIGDFKRTGQKVLASRDVESQIRLYKELRDIHLLNGVVGARGADRLTSEDYKDILKIYNAQIGLTDNKPEPYGLRYLISDILGDRVSETRLDQRLGMYAQGGEISKEMVHRNHLINEGKTEAKRVLGNTHKHCDDCIRYASWGWVGIKTLPLPKTRCQCLTNCVCSISYR